MTASTSTLREWWSPACNGDGMVTIPAGDQGARVTVGADVVAIFRAVFDIFARYRYAIRRADTGAYVCRPITGGTGYSLHAYGIAVDINWTSNPYGPNLVTDMPAGAIREIEALNVDGEQVVRWGGRYSSNKDAMHFEVVVTPATARRFRFAPQEDLTIVDDKTKKYLDKQFAEVDQKFAKRAEAEAQDRARAQRIEQKLDQLLAQ